MKKLLVLVLLLAAACASAQTVLYRNQATLQWDPVTTDVQGEPFLPSDTVSYEVYIYDYTAPPADVQNVSLLTFIGATSALEQLIVFPFRTIWAAGVRTKLVDGAAVVTYSTVAWSYIVADADPVLGPFVYSPAASPGKPKGLQDSGT